MNNEINHTKKILITGPVAPPAGGISIHIQRLEYVLKQHYQVDFVDESGVHKKNIFNIRSLNFIGYFKKIKESDLVFIHSGNRLFKKLHIISAYLLRKKIITTLHGYGNKRNWPARSWDSIIFNLSNIIILVNPFIKEKLKLISDKIVVRHAFLPPVMMNEQRLPEILEQEINNERIAGKILICANASELKRFNGEDLYGLDLCISAAEKLKKANRSIRFIYIVTKDCADSDMYKQAQEHIKSKNLEEYFTLMNENISFVRLMQQCDIMIRPTNTDGDSLSVREAIHMEKLVICSDAVSRPEQCILFKNRDLEDLVKKTEDAILLINKKEENSLPVNRSNDSENYGAFYFSLIDSLLNRG